MKNCNFFNITTVFFTNYNFTKIHAVDTSGSCLLLICVSLTSLRVKKKIPYRKFFAKKRKEKIMKLAEAGKRKLSKNFLFILSK